MADNIRRISRIGRPGQAVNLFLKKDKSVEDVVEVSDQMYLKALSKEVTKYYICFPKVVLES